MPSEIPPLQPGDPAQIGPYELLARLGSGGMGQVYLGRSPGGRTVAVKVIHSTFTYDPQFRRRFGREVAAARRIGGIYTAQVIDADSEAHPPWLATEYVAGPTLQQAVDQCGPLPERSVAALGAGLAEGLRAIHAQSVIHRDLKPGNVLLTEARPRIIDFGIARALDASSITTRTALIGTPGYMSPEQYRGEKVDTASDVFCLASVLVFAATGRRPFGDGPDHVLGYRVVAQDPDLTGVPASLLPLIKAGLKKNPAKRPPVAEFVNRCSALAGGRGMSLPTPVTTMIATRVARAKALVDKANAAGGAASPPQPVPPVPPPPRKTPSDWSGAAVAAVVVIFILFVGGIWLANRHDAQGTSGADSSSSPNPSPTVTTSYGDSGGYSTAPDEPTDPATDPPDTPIDDPTADAFNAVSAGDCLDAYLDPETQAWSEDVPETISCDQTNGYVRVTGVEDDSSSCPDEVGQTYWGYTGDDGTSTYLCLDREIHVGDCVLGKADGSHVDISTAGLMATWDCDSTQVPQGYNYILRITAYTDAYVTGSATCPDGSWTWTNVFGDGQLCAENAYHG